MSNLFIPGTGGSPPSDAAYDATSWDGNTDAATKNAIRDKIETLGGVHDPVTVTDSDEINFTLTGQAITAVLKAGSIVAGRLATAVQTSLGKADSAQQPPSEGAFVDGDKTKLDTYSEANQTANNAKVTYPSVDSTKVGHIAVTQAVNLDTMESDIATNNAKISFDSTASTKVGHIAVTQAVDLDQMEIDIAALANGMVYKDDWDASAGTFPGGGSAQIGWFYNVSVAGTVDSIAFAVGDSVIAKVDDASTGTYAANWVKKDQTDAVQSVVGLLGAITKSGLLAALNVEDGSTADQDLSGLAPKANPTFTGEIGVGSVNVSETELGILEGATLTTAELNYVDGVTSNVQTQLDAKLATLEDDTSPQLGGDLDLNGQRVDGSIISPDGGVAPDIGSTSAPYSRGYLGTLRSDTLNLESAGGDTMLQLDIVASSVNYTQIRPSATGNPVLYKALGTDTNIDINITPKGTGKVQANGVEVATVSDAQTVTNKRIQPRTNSTTSAATLAPDLASANVYYRTTQTVTLTIGAPTGTPVLGETIMMYIDSAGAETLTWNATYKAFGAALPTTTTAGKTLMVSAQWNGTNWSTLTAGLI